MQSLITEKFPGTIFCASRRAATARVNFYSRVQMYLFKAKQAAHAEYEAELKKFGISVGELREYLGTKRWRGSSLFYPRHGTVASTAANLVQHVAADSKKTRVGKLVDFTKAMLNRGAASASGAGASLRRGELMLGPLSDKLRALAHDRLQGAAQRPVVRRALDFASTVNDLLGKPVGGRAAPVTASPAPATPAVPVQAPVVVYFDGKDQRSRLKIEELLKARDITFKLLDVTDDEAERSWVITAAKSEEFPIVVVAGTPLGGLHELVQLASRASSSAASSGRSRSRKRARPQVAGALQVFSL